MLYLRHSKIMRLVVLPFTLTLFLSACHKWVPLEAPVPQALADVHPDPVRLTLSDTDDKIKLSRSAWRIEADTVFGAGSRSGGRLGIPITDITIVEQQKSKPLATAGMVLGGLVGFVVGAWAISCIGETSLACP